MNKIPLKTIVPNYDLFREASAASGYEIYLVGGAIRDHLISRLGSKPPAPTKDFDFIVFGDPLKFAEKWAAASFGTLVLLDEEERIYRVVMVKAGKTVFDFSAPKGDDHLSDAVARDFTINTLRADVTGGEGNDTGVNKIIDPLKRGIRDIKRGLIRGAGESSFQEDPLRLLRAFRFMATLPGFKIERGTLGRIGRERELIVSAARERLREEFSALFAGASSYPAIKLMEETKLLDAIFPEIEIMRGVTQNRYHSEDVLGHSLLCLKEAESIVERPEEHFPGRGDFISDYLNATVGSGWTRSSLIKFIALFHDVGKPDTRREKENGDGADGEATFYGHENRGAELFGKIAKRIILGKNAVRIGTRLIKNHMRLLSLASAEKVTERGIGRLIRDMGEEIPGLLIIGLADTLAGKKGISKSDRFKRNKRLIEAVFDSYERMCKGGRPVAPLISGKEIMTITGIEEGVEVGELKSEILLAQTMGSIKTRSEAICLLKDLMKKRARAR